MKVNIGRTVLTFFFFKYYVLQHIIWLTTYKVLEMQFWKCIVLMHILEKAKSQKINDKTILQSLKNSTF